MRHLLRGTHWATSSALRKAVGGDRAHHIIANLLRYAHENTEVLYFAGLHLLRLRLLKPS